MSENKKSEAPKESTPIQKIIKVINSINWNFTGSSDDVSGIPYVSFTVNLRHTDYRKIAKFRDKIEELFLNIDDGIKAEIIENKENV